MNGEFQPTSDATRQENVVERQYNGFAGVNSEARLRIIDAHVVDGRNFREEMIDAITVPGRGVVVDIGCSGAYMLRRLRQKQTSDDIMAVGIDIDNHSLKLARNIHDIDSGLAPGNYIKASMENIPLPDETVDTLIASFVLHHASDPPAVISEMHRVVKPGGQLLVSANSEGQKIMHSLVLRKIGEYLGIEPPRRFALNFSTEIALYALRRHFDDIQVTEQRTKMKFDDLEYVDFDRSLQTYKSEFEPSEVVQGSRVWSNIQDSVIRPFFTEIAQTEGYFFDNIDRAFYVCRKT